LDYARLLDDETLSFVRRTEGFYPPDASGMTLADHRRVYDEMAAAFRQPRPKGILVEDRVADGVPVRVYSAGQPGRSVLYFHGGGFVLGGLDSHDDICAEICAGTGYRVIAVDYRLAPEHKHPAAFDDAWTATRWVDTEFAVPIVLAGDSAGGNLAAAVAHHARGRLDAIMGQVLIYPGLGGGLDIPSMNEHADAPMLTRAEILYYKDIRVGDIDPDADPTYAPLADKSFAGLPPTILFSADCDPIRDDCRLYRDRLQAAHVLVRWINEEGLVHGYLRARTSVARAADSFERIVIGIEALGQGIWPDL
jgi:acetyl esterase